MPRSGQALRLRVLVPLVLAAGLAAQACGPAPTPPRNPEPQPTTPVPEPSAPPLPEAQPDEAAGDPFAIQGTLQEESLPLLKAPVFDLSSLPLPPAPKEIPPAPASCADFAKRKGAGFVKAAKCKDAASARAALDAALAETDPARRDAMLVDVEACAGLPVGVARALRAELAPPACGDAIAEPLVTSPPKTMNGAVYHALFGLTLGARLARTVTSPPKLEPPYDKKRVLDFVNGPMAAWIKDQARAIEETVQVGAKLPYYGKAVVAVEAGLADMRFVEAVRAVPVPTEFARDRELTDAYFGNLERALDPRKDRGRDAALVGLRELAFVGVIRDERVDRVRKLLSELYGGRRIDALDLLVLPLLVVPQPSSVEERLAARLPAFYAGLVLEPAAATRPATLRQLLQRGLSVPHRVALKAAGDLPPEVRLLYARARIELGQRYWRRMDFDHAAMLTSTWPAGAERPAEATFLLALAIALRGGPEDAAEMMRRSGGQAAGMGRVAALDAIAKDASSPLAAAAAFDAAVIKQVATPAGAGAAFFRDVARRFREAADKLSDARLKELALDRARAAEDTAAALQ